MPKKRHDKNLLIKPGSSTSQPSKSTARRDGENSPSVNDLIRESRMLQIKNEPVRSLTATSSIPPALRDVLSLPAPQAPLPRPVARPGGPMRLRRIAGPPPPRSWLVDSCHAPAPVQNDEDTLGRRMQTRTSNLPGGKYPDSRSLQHLLLKQMAINWEWHVDYDHSYLAALPVVLKEHLLGYVAVYGESIKINPLRLLFFIDEDAEEHTRVSRLDLSGAIGNWTSLRQLEKDFFPLKRAKNEKELLIEESQVLDSWDDSEQVEVPGIRSISPSLTFAFVNLKHLSLALTPGVTASWKDLIRLAGGLSTITSLSLAYWPQPTYTPRAASTRIVVKPIASIPGIVYGGSNFYTAFDNDWREAAGILRSLSKALYCLKWLDLTGCGEWFNALIWQSPTEEAVGPEWNGSWRGIQYLGLGVGWTPLEPESVTSAVQDSNADEWNVEEERKKYRYRKDVEEYRAIMRSARNVAQYLRELRKSQSGKWVDVDLGIEEGEL